MFYFFILIVIIILALIYMRFEASFLEVKRVKLTKNKSCLKIIQLSDIHINRLKVSASRIRDVIHKEQPDIIILTGDYIESAKHKPMFISFLNQLNAPSSIYCCLGNHDHKAFRGQENEIYEYISDIEKAGVTVLQNKCISIEKSSNKYNIIGIGDLRYKHHNFDEAFKDCCKDALINIGFSHNPDIALEIPKDKLDYLFCGHFHGGQIWAPFNLEFKILRHEKLCKEGIKSGLHKVNGINLYISRGLGNVCFPLRFLSRPEVTVFYLP